MRKCRMTSSFLQMWRDEFFMGKNASMFLPTLSTSYSKYKGEHNLFYLLCLRSQFSTT